MDNQKEISHVDKGILNAKAHLDLSLDFFIRVIQRKGDQEAIIAKAERTLGKASKIIYDLAWSVENQEEQSDRSRSRKKRPRSESVLDISETSELQEAETNHRESSASRSPERVRFPVLEYLSCWLSLSNLFYEF